MNPDYKLADMLGIAGATIGIMIASGILLQCVSSRYVAVFDRFRALTGEYRTNNFSDPRRGSLQNQISAYRRQTWYLNLSYLCMTLALIAFIITVTVASLSVIYPAYLAIRLVGTITLFTGLGFIVVGTVLVGLENATERKIMHQEVVDFSDLPTAHEAVHR